MKMLAEITGPWTADAMGHLPQLMQDYAIESFEDVTGTPADHIPPDPNLVSLQVVCDDAVLAQIADDPTYSILWSQPQ